MQFDIKKLKNRIFKTDPQLENELNVSKFRDTIQDSAFTFEDIYIDKDTFIDFISIGTNGALMVLPADEAQENEKFYREKIREIRSFFGLNNKNSFFFLYNDDESFYVSEKLIPVDDIYEAFGNLYDNLLRPYVDVAHIDFKSVEDLLKKPETPEAYKDIDPEDEGEPEFARAIIPYEDADDVAEMEDGADNDSKTADHSIKTVTSSAIKTVENTNKFKKISNVKTVNLIDDIADKCRALEGEPRPSGKQKVVDGVTYLYKDSDVSLGTRGVKVNTGLVGSKTWYPVSDEDPDKILLLTTVGGWFGLHKLYMGRFMEGLLYLLTCGCVGILPAIDAFLLLMGNGSYYVDDYSDGTKVRQKYFIRRPSNKVIAMAAVPVCFVIGLILTNTLYNAMGIGIIELITKASSNMTPEQADGIANTLSRLLGN